MTLRSLLQSKLARSVRQPSSEPAPRRPAASGPPGNAPSRARPDSFDAQGPAPRKEVRDEHRQPSLCDAHLDGQLEDAAAKLREHALKKSLQEARRDGRLDEAGAALRERALREALTDARRDGRLDDVSSALREHALREALTDARRDGRLDDVSSALREHALREALTDARRDGRLDDVSSALREHALREALTDAHRDGQLEKLEDALRMHALREQGARVGEVLEDLVPASPQTADTTSWHVQPGDTVGDIAWSLMQQGVPGPVEEIARQIVQLNGLENPDLIIAGSTLTVPAPPSSPGTVAPSTPGAPSSPGTAAPSTPGAPSSPGTVAPSSPGTTPPTAPGEMYPVPYINQITSEGTEDDWNRNSNCGPTTMAMILKGYGFGGGLSDGAFINQLANSIGMGAEGTGYVGIEQMATNMGLTSETHAGSDVSWIQQQLAAGNLVAVNGESSVMLANEQPPYASGNFSGGHWIAVTGMTPEGNFIVHDPSSTCRELTPEQLSRFLAEHHAGGFATAIHPPPGVSPAAPTSPTASAQGQHLESLRLAPGAWSLAETGFAGQGEHLLQLSEQYDVPIDLALAMLWKESQWGTTGLSHEHNNPGNLKFVGQEGAHEAFTSSGAAGSFAGWPTMEQGIEAYFKLLGTHYRDFIDSGDWQGLVYRYAPPSENDSARYLQQVYDYAAVVREHLGLE